MEYHSKTHQSYIVIFSAHSCLYSANDDNMDAMLRERGSSTKNSLISLGITCYSKKNCFHIGTFNTHNLKISEVTQTRLCHKKEIY